MHAFRDDGLRVNDLAVSPDGSRLVAILESRILVYDFATYEKLCEWHLDDLKLTSVTISQDSRHMLISMNKDQIKLMEIDTGELVQRFEGQVQQQYIIRSCFGGADENFVVSGSEGKSIGWHKVDSKGLTNQTPESTSGGVMACSLKLSTGTPAALMPLHGIPRIPASSRPPVTTPKSASGSRPRQK